MAHRKVSKGNRWEEMKGDGTRCVLRTSSPHVGFSPTPSPPQKNKKTLEEEEGELEGGVLDKGTSDRVWKRRNLVAPSTAAFYLLLKFLFETFR